jgi:hypothetical protein
MVINSHQRPFELLRANTNYLPVRQAYETGVPMTRPFLLHFPDDPGARAVNDQFLLGEELIVAPVLAPGAVARDVFLPRGSGVWTRVPFATNSSSSGSSPSGSSPSSSSSGGSSSSGSGGSGGSGGRSSSSGGSSSGGIDYDCTDPVKDCSITGAPAPIGNPLVFALKSGAHYDLLMAVGSETN